MRRRTVRGLPLRMVLFAGAVRAAAGAECDCYGFDSTKLPSNEMLSPTGKPAQLQCEASFISPDRVIDDNHQNDCGKSRWSWDPPSEHRCTIERFNRDQLIHRFGPTGIPSLYHAPIIVDRRGWNDPNIGFRRRTTKTELVRALGANLTVSLSSSNAVSEHMRSVPLYVYLDEMSQSPETGPNQRSNETWYLFGRTYSEPWQNLLQYYVLPPCKTCRYGNEITSLVSLSFGMGNQGSGVQWHVHGPGFSETIHGRKHWIMYPPSDTPPFQYHKDQSSRHWMEYSYPIVPNKPWECTLEPGQALYFPDRWWHATINLDPYTVFVSTFTSEHDDVTNKQENDEMLQSFLCTP